MRKIIIILTSCLVLLLVTYVGYRSYLVWKQSHGIAMAKVYFGKSDYRNGFLSLQQVLKANPRNVEGCRMMANLLEAEHSPNALSWRERVLELAPGSFEDRLALAQSAMINHNYSLATNALAGAAEAGKGSETYHSIAGTVALMGGLPDEAEAQFAEAIRLAPADPVPQMNLAVVRLHRTNSLDMAEARIALQRIVQSSTNASLRVQARRELIADAMRFKDSSTALSLSKDLVQDPSSQFSDKLLRLDVLKKTGSADFKPSLTFYQSRTTTNLLEITELTTWQMANLPVTECLNWLKQLPVQTRTNQTVEFLAASCQLQLGDWREVQESIQQENWYDASRPWADLDFMRHAYLARSLRGQGLTEASSAEWAVAVKSVGDQKYSTKKDHFKELFNLAVGWGWNTEAEDILWTVVNQYPEEKWAFPILRNALISFHRTKSLMQLLDIMYKRTPDNPAIENDLAATAMLLGDQEIKPYDMAQEVYEKDPKNPSFASTYAFALYKQGKYPAALKIMHQLSPKDLQNPSVAGYYAVILKANGNKADARAYLNLASNAQLLPEEQALFEQARAGL